MIIDTHAHLDFPDFKDDIDEVIDRARGVGVEYLINVGTTVASSRKSIELAKKYSSEDAGSFVNGILSKVSKVSELPAEQTSSE